MNNFRGVSHRARQHSASSTYACGRRSVERLINSARPYTLVALALLSCSSLAAQRSKDQGEFSRYAGDAPRHALPYATYLSPEIKRKDISAALTKVADWQLRRSAGHFDNDWTFAVLYTGFMAIPQPVAGDKYQIAMKSMGDSLHWQMGPDTLDANDLAVGATYLDLYQLYKEPAILHTVQERIETVMQQSRTQPRPLWWWCDALFVGPATFTKLAQITGNRRYLDFMDRQWWTTSSQLYDTNRKLYYRDQRFLTRHETNGAPVFWARGSGWVLAGLARVLQTMPNDYPSRPKYIAQFQEMAASLTALQRPNGLWTAGLLDPDSYPADETSGTSLITYGLAYGVNSGILNKAQYEPHIALAWRGLVAHVFTDGRLGSVQKVADSPGHLKPTSSYVYGVGGFLLAGSEVYRMATD